jgi:hypothetical protein
MTISAACNEVGIPRSTFYDVCKRNPEMLAKIQEVFEVHVQQQLGLILSNKTAILLKVIDDVLSDDTKPRDRLAIYKALSEIEERLTNNLQIESEAAAQAHEFLKQGPMTSTQASRLTVTTEKAITIESERQLEAGSSGE